jgi:hypothetical protein
MKPLPQTGEEAQKTDPVGGFDRRVLGAAVFASPTMRGTDTDPWNSFFPWALGAAVSAPPTVPLIGENSHTGTHSDPPPQTHTETHPEDTHRDTHTHTHTHTHRINATTTTDRTGGAENRPMDRFRAGSWWLPFPPRPEAGRRGKQAHGQISGRMCDPHALPPTHAHH